jgi:WbqC-like protein
MKLGIMQPYFFPYIGYWQLVNAVDTYVIYDDVNFIKNGWINRNRILINGEAKYFNLPVVGAGSFVLIKDIAMNPKPELIGKLLRTLENSYRKAPCYTEVMPMLERIMTCGKTKMAELLEFQIREIAHYLNLKTTLLVSSRDVKKDKDLHAQDRVLDICKNLNATEYYNAIGGQELYDRKTFAERKLKLSFLQTDEIVYRQFRNDFIPNLSIIDVLMFNSTEQVHEFLHQYTLR